MPLSNKCVCYCHTNIGNCSLNGAFIIYILTDIYTTLLLESVKMLIALLKNKRGDYVFEYDRC
mgnify:CR=1 FL=1